MKDKDTMLSDDGAMWDEAIESHTYMVPIHMQDEVKRYILHGVPMGSFLTLLFSNDFMGAAARADHSNLAAMGRWARFIYNAVPRGSWGSEGNVLTWMASGGIEGLAQSRAKESAE